MITESLQSQSFSTDEPTTWLLPHHGPDIRPSAPSAPSAPWRCHPFLSKCFATRFGQVEVAPFQHGIPTEFTELCLDVEASQPPHRLRQEELPSFPLDQHCGNPQADPVELTCRAEAVRSEFIKCSASGSRASSLYHQFRAFVSHIRRSWAQCHRATSGVRNKDEQRR